MNQLDLSTRRAIIILAVSITIGLVTAWLIARWMERTLEKGTVSLVVAARDLNPGEKLASNDLRLTLWPAGSVMPGASHMMIPLHGRVVAQPRGGHRRRPLHEKDPGANPKTTKKRRVA